MGMQYRLFVVAFVAYVGLGSVEALRVRVATQSVVLPGGELPNAPGTVKFAVIGDSGTGEAPQYEVARQLAAAREVFPFQFVIMLGDNLYGSQKPEDRVAKFERPYEPLLRAGVEFYAALGNSDLRTNRFYEPWNMKGHRYYSYARGDVRFIVLDSTELDVEQVQWLEGELAAATEPWTICYFHHPIYSHGWHADSAHARDLRAALEPLFIRFGVDVVYSGHDHIYERLALQQGILYFVVGASGQLQVNSLVHSSDTAAGFDQDRSFMLNEVVRDRLYFRAVSRTGQVIDTGSLVRHARP
jgi:hypothetical protein